MLLGLDHPPAGHHLQVVRPDRLGQLPRPELFIRAPQPRILAHAKPLREAAVIKQQPPGSILDVTQERAGIHEGTKQFFTCPQICGGPFFLRHRLRQGLPLHDRFKLYAHLPAQHLERVSLFRRQDPRRHIDNAQRTQRLPIRRKQGHSGKKPNRRIARHQRIGVKPPIHQRILHQKHLRLPNRMGAEGHLSWRLPHLQMSGRAEPLVPLIQQRHQSDWSSTDRSRKLHQFLTFKFWLGVQ